MPDESFNRLLRRAVNRPTDAGPCPEPSELAAFVEGTLSPAERTLMEAHASACEQCTGALALLVRLPEATGTPTLSARRTIFGWPWQWAVPLATAVVVFAVWSESTRDTSGPTAPATVRVEQAPSPDPASEQTAPPMARQAPSHLSKPRRTVAPPQAAALPPALPSSTVTSRPALAPAPVPGSAAKARAERDSTSARSASAGLRKEEEHQQHAAEDKSLGNAAAGDARQDRPAATAEPAEIGGLAETIVIGEERRTAATAPENQELSAGSGGPARARVPLVVRASDLIQVRVNRDRIERTSDGGTTWQTERSGLSSPMLAGACVSTDVCWLGGAGGHVLRREPGGRWVEGRIPSDARVAAIDARDASRAIVTVSDGRRFSTSDGGQSWTPAP
jgi:hypothetical protein